MVQVNPVSCWHTKTTGQQHELPGRNISLTCLRIGTVTVTINCDKLVLIYKQNYYCY